MSKKFYILANPTSGSNKGASSLKKLKDKLSEKNIEFEEEISKYSGQMTLLAKSAANKIQKNDEIILIVVGGDGSFNQALNGVKQSRYPDTALAYLPSGTGDDFARALNLLTDTEQIIKKLLQNPEVTEVDCGYYFDENKDKSGYFINNLGIGFDAYVVAQSNNSTLKKRFNHLHIGNLTYGVKILKALTHQENFGVTITENGYFHHFDDAYLVTTTNHPYFGGGVPILPKANPFSHKLDTIVVEKPSTLKFIYLFSRLLLNGSHVNDPHFHYFEADKISVRTKELEYGQLDGEELGSRSFNLHFKIDKFNLLH